MFSVNLPTRWLVVGFAIVTDSAAFIGVTVVNSDFFFFKSLFLFPGVAATALWLSWMPATDLSTLRAREDWMLTGPA